MDSGTVGSILDNMIMAFAIMHLSVQYLRCNHKVRSHYLSLPLAGKGLIILSHILGFLIANLQELNSR